MRKKIFFTLAAISGLAILLSAAVCRAETIAGGSTFETAVLLKAGSFAGRTLADGAVQYFYITLADGQQLNVQAIITGSSSTGSFENLKIYNQDREQLVDKYGGNYSTQTLNASWLAGTDKTQSRYYVALVSDSTATEAFTMEVSVTDKYDADAAKDAPATFDGALTVAAGTIKGYISGDAGYDTLDMYKFTPASSGTYAITLTQPEKAQVTVTVYDSNRTELDKQYSANAGAIVKSSFVGTKDSAAYIAIGCESGCASETANYSFVLAAPANANTNAAAANLNTAANTNANANANINANVNANANVNNANSVAATNLTANTNAASAETESESSTTLYLIIGGAVVVVVIVVIVIVARKKKTPPAATPQK